MPTYEFQATNEQGQSEAGNVIGTSLEQALSDLGKRGLKVERINVLQFLNDPLAGSSVTSPPMESPRAEQSKDPLQEPSAVPMPPRPDIVGPRSYVATNIVGPVVGRVPLATVGFFFRQLSTMLKAGVPINQSLDTLSNQARDPRMQAMVREIAIHVKEGRPISTGLQRYPETVTPVMLSLIRVGEEAGFLDDALAQVADYIDREIELRNLYKRSTFYPKLVLGASFVIVGVTNTILGGLGKSDRLKMPFAVETWIFIGIAVFAIWLFLRVGLANPRIKYNWDAVTLRIPVLGKTMRQLAMAKFGRAFGALYKAGVPITKGMPLAADACGNEYLRAKMYPAFRGMQEGSGIQETFARTNAFTPIILDMVGTGEKTGNMEQMVEKVADYYEGEAETRQNALAAVTGVVVLLILAVYVGYMVITFYTDHYGGMMQESGAMITVPFFR